MHSKIEFPNQQYLYTIDNDTLGCTYPLFHFSIFKRKRTSKPKSIALLKNWKIVILPSLVLNTKFAICYRVCVGYYSWSLRTPRMLTNAKCEFIVIELHENYSCPNEWHLGHCPCRCASCPCGYVIVVICWWQYWWVVKLCSAAVAAGAMWIVILILMRGVRVYCNVFLVLFVWYCLLCLSVFW